MPSRDHMLGFPPLVEFLGEKKSTSHLYTPPRERKTLVEQDLDKIRDNTQVPEQYKQKGPTKQSPESCYWTHPDYAYEYRISEQDTPVQYRLPFVSDRPDLPRPWREVPQSPMQAESFKKRLHEPGWESHYE